MSTPDPDRRLSRCGAAARQHTRKAARASYPLADGRMKETGEEYDGRIVEVCWDQERAGWRMFRFRDDKPQGNHATTVRSVLHSIEDGVEIADVSGPLLAVPVLRCPGTQLTQQVLAQQDKVKAAWKTREQRNRGGAAPAAPPRPPNGQYSKPAPPPPSHAAGHAGHGAPPPPRAMSGLKR